MFAHRHPTSHLHAASMRFNKLAVWAGLALLFLHLMSTAAFSQGIIKTFDFPGAVYTAAEDINNSGEVVGYHYAEPDEVSHGFWYINGQFTPYDVPGSTYTQIRGINRWGDFVGFYGDDQNNTHGFLRDHGGQVTPLDFFGVNQTFPTGINDQGTIVGTCIDANQVWHFFVYSQGHAVQFDVPNTTVPPNVGWPKINNSGSIVGTVTDNNTGEIRAALVSNSSSILFNVNGQNSTARGISASGAITGFYHGGESGYVLSNGTITLIQVPGALDTKPLGINDHRQITGTYDDANGGHGFIMQVP